MFQQKEKKTKKIASQSILYTKKTRQKRVVSRKKESIFAKFNVPKRKQVATKVAREHKIVKVPDLAFLAVVVLLVCFGIAMIFSASGLIAFRYYDGDTLYFVKRQILWVIVGLIVGVFVYRLDKKVIRKLSFWLFIVGIALLLYLIPEAISPTLESGAKLLEVPFAKTLNGATRWLDFGFFDVQPSEFIKIPLILYICAWLTKSEKEDEAYYKRIKHFKDTQVLVYALKLIIYKYFPYFITGFVSILILLQKELDTIAIILIAVFAVMFVSGKNRLNIYLTSIFTLLAGIIAIFSTSYRSARFGAFWQIFTTGTLDEIYRRGDGFQVWQVLIAIGSGGLFGIGFNESKIKRFFLQEAAYTDSIFAIIGEELGLFGISLVVLAFLLILALGFNIALRTEDKFEKLVVVGITSLIVAQAFLNIAANLSIIPFGGMPLPFISYGGSTTIMLLVGVAIVLNISKQEVRTFSRV